MQSGQSVDPTSDICSGDLQSCLRYVCISLTAIVGWTEADIQPAKEVKDSVC